MVNKINETSNPENKYKHLRESKWARENHLYSPMPDGYCSLCGYRWGEFCFSKISKESAATMETTMTKKLAIKLIMVMIIMSLSSCTCHSTWFHRCGKRAKPSKEISVSFPARTSSYQNLVPVKSRS